MKIGTTSSKVLNYLNIARQNQSAAVNSMEKLSSGLQINRGADNPMGIGVVSNMQRNVRGIDTAMHNVQDGISEVNIIDGGMREISDIILRMRELAVKASNAAVLTTNESTILNNEYQSLINEVDRIANATRFNGVQVLTGGTVTIIGSTEDLVIRLVWATGGTDKNELSMAITDPSSNTINSSGQTSPPPLSNANGSLTADTNPQGNDGALNYETEYYTVTPGASLDGTYQVTATFDVAVDSLSENVTITATSAVTGFGGTQTYTETINELQTTVPFVINWSKEQQTQQEPGVFQVGPDGTTSNKYYIYYPDARTSNLGVSGSLATASAAQTAIASLDSAMNKLNTYIARNGGYGMDLGRIINDLSTTKINTMSAESKIQDTNFAEETMRFTSKNLALDFQAAIASQSMIDYRAVEFLINNSIF